jgi:hypothetical protein
VGEVLIGSTEETGALDHRFAVGARQEREGFAVREEGRNG